MRRAVFVLGLLLASSTANADCPSVRWNFRLGQETTTSRVTDGTPCFFRMTDVNQLFVHGNRLWAIDVGPPAKFFPQWKTTPLPGTEPIRPAATEAYPS